LPEVVKGVDVKREGRVSLLVNGPESSSI